MRLTKKKQTQKMHYKCFLAILAKRAKEAVADYVVDHDPIIV
jgi:hypothetical protein